MALRNAEASSPAVMRPFRSRIMMPSRSRLCISRLMLNLSFRVLHLQSLHGPNDHFRHRVIAKPLVIGGNDVPRCVLRAAVREGVFERILILVPVLALGEIRRG